MTESESSPKKGRGWYRIPEISAAVGALLWLVGNVFFTRSLETHGWADGLLMLAALVIVPLALRLSVVRDDRGRPPKSWVRSVLLQPVGAVTLALSYTLPVGWQAGGWSIGWLLLTLQVALYGIARARIVGTLPLHELSIHAGLVMLAIGGGWTVVARFGMTLGFQEVLVLLTAVHFHYAGLALPLFAGLAVRARPSFLGRAGIALVLLGVPAVAAGITVAEWGGGRVLESFAAIITCVGAWIVAWLHVRLALEGSGTKWAGRLWWVSAISLALGMVLAALYGLREYVPTDWLDIPTMRALHGTMQGVGFGALGAFAWFLFERRQQGGSGAPAGADEKDPA